MRQLYLLMLLFTAFTSFAFAPPVITNPAPLTPCDIDNDGIEVVDLTQVIPQVLGALNPSLYTLTFHNSLTDANGDVNAIPNPTAFLAVSGAHYIRVEENADTTNFSTTTLQIMLTMLPTAAINGPTTVCGGDEITIAFQGSGGGEPFTFDYAVNGGAVLTAVTPFDLNAVGINLPTIASGTYDIDLISVMTAAGCMNTIHFLHHIDVLPTPTPLQPLDLSIEQIPFTGTAIFDLTSNESLLLNGDSNVTISYFSTVTDAEINANVILAPAAFSGFNGEHIGVRVTNNSTGCSVVKSFYLYITNPDIVFIPDPYFKQELILTSPTVDTNSDGEIQVTEALVYTYLNVDGTDINSLEGINSFINLTHFAISNSNVSTMNISELTNLTELFCDNNQLTSLDVSNSPNLVNLQCANNQLTTLNISGLTHLQFLSCYINQLTSINVVGMNTLESLDCRNNNLTSLDLSGLTNLLVLNCNTNLLTTLDVTDSPNLTQLACAFNSLPTLDMTPYPNLSYLACGGSELNTVDISSITHLTIFYLYGTQQSVLDISNSHSITYALVNNCPNLNVLNLKNGYAALNFNLFNLPNLNFICANESNFTSLNTIIGNSSNNINPAAVVNSYCSFNPGGDYNTITGSVTFDADNNGCNGGDSAQPNIKIRFSSPIEMGASFTNASGNYTFYTEEGGFSWVPDIENPTWFNFSPTTGSTLFSDDNNNTFTQNFCITANGIHPDLEIVVVPLSNARPGFDAYYGIVLRNKGNSVITQTNDGIVFLYDHNRMNLVSTSDPVSLLIGPPGTLNWDVINLSPFESRSIYLTMHINTPTDPNFPVNNGDLLTFNATANPISGDENPSDNTFQFNQTVVGSFDPNDIVCIDGNIVSPIEIGNYLHYVINFENTGTADAENIVVREVIDTDQFDVNSLQLMNSSAPVSARLTGNVVEFVFQNINLHSGGHGNILLKIKSKNTLVQGDTVSKRASIYFDYNFPVDTSIENTIFQSLNNPDVPVDASISIFPNPTKGNVNINCNNNIKSVQLYDIQGRILLTSLVNENQTIIDISNQSNGVYFLKIISDKGIGVKKIVKE